MIKRESILRKLEMYILHISFGEMGITFTSTSVIKSHQIIGQIGVNLFYSQGCLVCFGNYLIQIIDVVWKTCIRLSNLQRLPETTVKMLSPSMV